MQQKGAGEVSRVDKAAVEWVREGPADVPEVWENIVSSISFACFHLNHGRKSM